jgi:isopenicillin N synthase-like dioxygenase
VRPAEEPELEPLVTDFGIVTTFDRQDGVGGLQIYTPDGRWVNAPYVEDSFTIDIGDLPACWTGDRWRSNRHRVLAHEPARASDYLLEKLNAIIVS